LKEASKPLYNFGEKKIELVGSISLPVSFSTLSNAHTEYIAFDVIDMSYPNNAIFRRGLLNTFKAALHLLYLCLKIAATLGGYFSSWQLERRKKHRTGFYPRPQKCKISTG
jgi:hypothetical protein